MDPTRLVRGAGPDCAGERLRNRTFALRNDGRVRSRGGEARCCRTARGSCQQDPIAWGRGMAATSLSMLPWAGSDCAGARRISMLWIFYLCGRVRSRGVRFSHPERSSLRLSDGCPSFCPRMALLTIRYRGARSETIFTMA